MNHLIQQIVKKGFSLVIGLMLIMSSVMPAQARILFQSDDEASFESPALILDGDGTGTENTYIQFGNDPTASENGQLQWNITENEFQFDHGVDVTGDVEISNGLSVTGGNINFVSSSQMRFRESNFTPAPACTTLNEVVFDTSAKALKYCTLVGTPGTWADVDGALSHLQNSDTGTTQDSFVVNSDADDATLQFGQNADGQIVYIDAADTFDFDANRIVNILNPSSAQDAATKSYVDSVLSGLSWRGPIQHLNQLQDGGVGVGGIRGGGSITVSDETQVVENDTLTITYNSGGNTIILTAKDAPTGASCEFESGATATDNADMAVSILDAINACATASPYSGQSVIISNAVYVVHDDVGTVGNGTIVASGSGFETNNMTEGKDYASIVSNETLISQHNQATYTWDEDNDNWVQITGVDSLPTATTTSKGVVELAEDGETNAGVAVQGNDSRLHSQNTDSGSNQDTFILNNDADNAVLQFGQNIDGQISYDDAANTFDFDNNRLINIPDPTSSTDAATKGYVDGVSAGLNWREPVFINNQLVSGGAGGIRAGGLITVTDETQVVENDTIVVTYNSGGSTFTLTAKDAPVAANCEFESGATAVDNADMAVSIAVAVITCPTPAADFSLGTVRSDATVYLVHDSVGTVGNGTIMPSGNGFLMNHLDDGTPYAGLAVNETRVSLFSDRTYNHNGTDNWVQVSGTTTVPDATTTTAGKVELATDGETASNVAVQGSDSRLHSQNTDTGSTTETFTLNTDDTAGDAALKFGGTLTETLTWDTSEDYFFLSDDFVVDGNVNLQGTTLRLDSDETGNPDQDLEIIFGQGSENTGTLRYDDGNNRFEISNNGGAFEEVVTGDVDAQTLDSFDSSQFLRTDTSDSVTSGTTTFDAGTVLDINGAFDASGASRFGIQQDSSDPGACIVGDMFYNTTSSLLKMCTALNTWTAVDTDTVNDPSLDDAYNNGQSITVDADGDLIFNLANTQDFIIQDNSVSFATFTDTGDFNLDNNLTVGAAAETIDDAGFSLDGDDVFISGDLGVEGAIYTDNTETKYLWLDIFGGIEDSTVAGYKISDTVPVMRFDPNNDSSIRWSFPVPDDWVAGTNILVRIYWSPSNTDTGGVRWLNNYGAVPVGEVLDDTDVTQVSVTEAAGGTTNQVQTEVFTISNGGISLNEMMFFMIMRDVGHAEDTYTGNVDIHEIRIEYTGKKVL